MIIVKLPLVVVPPTSVKLGNSQQSFKLDFNLSTGSLKEKSLSQIQKSIIPRVCIGSRLEIKIQLRVPN